MWSICPLLQCQRSLIFLFLQYKALCKTYTKTHMNSICIVEWMVFSRLFLLWIYGFYSMVKVCNYCIMKSKNILPAAGIFFAIQNMLIGIQLTYINIVHTTTSILCPCSFFPVIFLNFHMSGSYNFILFKNLLYIFDL